MNGPKSVFRVWWHPGQPWAWFRHEPATLAKYVERAGGVDCFHTLNVWSSPDHDTPCNYDYGFDFDSPDIRKSATDAQHLAAYFDDLGVPYGLYFSGSKGIHIVVPHESTQLEPRLDGGHVCKLFQRQLKSDLYLETLDTEIHGRSRQWRIPNTINSKSGLYKVRLSSTCLQWLIEHGLEAARAIAWAPGFDPPIPVAEGDRLHQILLPFVAAADAENEKFAEQQKQRLNAQLKSTPLCIQQIMNNPALIKRQAATWRKKIPSRNNLTFIAATFLKSHAGASEAQALRVLGKEWQDRVASIASSSPLEIERSTRTCVATVYRGNYEFACGTAISYGCDCSPACPLYIPFERDKSK